MWLLNWYVVFALIIFQNKFTINALCTPPPPKKMCNMHNFQSLMRNIRHNNFDMCSIFSRQNWRCNIVACVYDIMMVTKVIICIFSNLQNYSRRWLHKWRQQAVQACGVQQYNPVTSGHHTCYGHTTHWLWGPRKRGKDKYLPCACQYQSGEVL